MNRLLWYCETISIQLSCEGTQLGDYVLEDEHKVNSEKNDNLTNMKVNAQAYSSSTFEVQVDHHITIPSSPL